MSLMGPGARVGAGESGNRSPGGGAGKRGAGDSVFFCSS